MRACIVAGAGELHGGSREHFADGLEPSIEALIAWLAFLFSEEADDVRSHEGGYRMHVFLREVEAELARPCFREGSFETFSEARRSVRPRQQADALHGASLIFIETELRAAFREELFGEIGDAGWDGGVDRLLGKVFDRVEIVVEGCAVASRLARDRGGGHFAIRHSRELIPKRLDHARFGTFLFRILAGACHGGILSSRIEPSEVARTG